MPRRILEGRVVSNKAEKTINVIVERRYMHPVYKKYIKSTNKFAAHDEANLCKEGDLVSIEECRPISKSKKWVVVKQNGNAVTAAPVTTAKKAVKK